MAATSASAAGDDGTSGGGAHDATLAAALGEVAVPYGAPSGASPADAVLAAVRASLCTAPPLAGIVARLAAAADGGSSGSSVGGSGDESVWSALPLAPTVAERGRYAHTCLLTRAVTAAGAPLPPAGALTLTHFAVRGEDGRVAATSLHTDGAGRAIGGDDHAAELALDDAPGELFGVTEVVGASAVDVPTQALWVSALRSASARLPAGGVAHVVMYCRPDAAPAPSWEAFIGCVTWRIGLPPLPRAAAAAASVAPPPAAAARRADAHDSDSDSVPATEPTIARCRRALAAKDEGNAHLAGGRHAAARTAYTRGISTLYAAEAEAEEAGGMAEVDRLRVRAIKATLCNNRSLAALREGDATSAAWDAGNAIGAIPRPYPPPPDAAAAAAAVLPPAAAGGDSEEVVRLLLATPPVVDWAAMHVKALYRRAAAAAADAGGEIGKATAKPRQVAKLDRAADKLRDAAADLRDAATIQAAAGNAGAYCWLGWVPTYMARHTRIHTDTHLADASLDVLAAEVAAKTRMVAALQRAEESQVVASYRRAQARAAAATAATPSGVPADATPAPAPAASAPAPADAPAASDTSLPPLE